MCKRVRLMSSVWRLYVHWKAIVCNEVEYKKLM